MIRLERLKDGTLRFTVAGKEVPLPEVGQCIALQPSVTYSPPRIENASDKGDMT